MRRGRDSVSIVVGREKRGNNASIHANCFLGGAMPVAGSMPMPQREEWPTTCGRHLGNQEHPHLSTLRLGNVPTRVEAFPELFLSAAALPKAVEWIPVPSQQQIAWYIWKNTVVFLPIALR